MKPLCRCKVGTNENKNPPLFPLLQRGMKGGFSLLHQGILNDKTGKNYGNH